MPDSIQKPLGYAPIKDVRDRLIAEVNIKLSDSQILAIAENQGVDCYRIRGELILNLDDLVQKIPTYSIEASNKLKQVRQRAKDRSSLYQKFVAFALFRLKERANQSGEAGEKVIDDLKENIEDLAQRRFNDDEILDLLDRYTARSKVKALATEKTLGQRIEEADS